MGLSQRSGGRGAKRARRFGGSLSVIVQVVEVEGVARLRKALYEQDPCYNGEDARDADRLRGRATVEEDSRGVCRVG